MLKDWREVFAAKKVDLDQPITTTCGSGATVAVIALALEISGAPQISIYDVIVGEHAQRPEAVIERDS